MKTFKPGDRVHLTLEYFRTNRLSLLELPRYNWTVVSIEGDMVSIKYDRPNKPFRGMLVDPRYLTDSIL